MAALRLRHAISLATAKRAIGRRAAANGDRPMQEKAEPLGPFPIYVPHADQQELAEVLPGSAIVGFPIEANPGRIHVYYEGNRYDIPEFARFADRVRQAAGRCRWYRLDVEQWRRDHGDVPPPPTQYGYVSYPTSSQALVSTASLVQVALYDDILGLVTPIGPDEGALLHNWIGSSDPVELVATGRIFEARRAASGPESSGGLQPGGKT